MIVKRLLRFALGPSFLDPDVDKEYESIHKTAEASKSNRELTDRVSSADAEILKFLGIGSGGWRPAFSRDRLRSRVGAGSSRRARISERYLPAAFSVLFLQCHWPTSVVRCRIQTYRFGSNETYFSAARTVLSSPIRVGSLYGGIACAGLHELLTTAYLIPLEASALAFPVELALMVVGWLALLPLNYHSLKQLVGVKGLGILPPVADFLNVFKPRYLWQHRVEFGLIGLSSFINAKIKAVIMGVLDLLGGSSRDKPRSSSTQFILEVLPSVLGDMIALPLSQAVLRTIAQIAGQPNVCGVLELANIKLIARALTVEWVVSWTLTELFYHAQRLLA